MPIQAQFTGPTPAEIKVTKQSQLLQSIQSSAELLQKAKENAIKTGWDNFFKLAEQHPGGPAGFAASDADKAFMKGAFKGWGIDGEALAEQIEHMEMPVDKQWEMMRAMATNDKFNLDALKQWSDQQAAGKAAVTEALKTSDLGARMEEQKKAATGSFEPGIAEQGAAGFTATIMTTPKTMNRSALTNEQKLAMDKIGQYDEGWLKRSAYDEPLANYLMTMGTQALTKGDQAQIQAIVKDIGKNDISLDIQALVHPKVYKKVKADPDAYSALLTMELGRRVRLGQIKGTDGKPLDIQPPPGTMDAEPQAPAQGATAGAAQGSTQGPAAASEDDRAAFTKYVVDNFDALKASGTFSPKATKPTGRESTDLRQANPILYRVWKEGNAKIFAAQQEEAGKSPAQKQVEARGISEMVGGVRKFIVSSNVQQPKAGRYSPEMTRRMISFAQNMQNQMVDENGNQVDMRDYISNQLVQAKAAEVNQALANVRLAESGANLNQAQARLMSVQADQLQASEKAAGEALKSKIPSLEFAQKVLEKRPEVMVFNQQIALIAANAKKEDPVKALEKIRKVIAVFADDKTGSEAVRQYLAGMTGMAIAAIGGEATPEQINTVIGAWLLSKGQQYSGTVWGPNFTGTTGAATPENSGAGGTPSTKVDALTNKYLP